MKLAVRQSIASLAVFVAVLLMLVSVDDRVRDRFSDLASGSGRSSISHRAGDLTGALMTAARQQSIENAPLLIFAVGGAVLVVFMVKA
ncbi:MAG: hypothetical protein V7647_2870 [Acidobacteriota bacterium]|jgi:hypothetical protein